MKCKNRKSALLASILAAAMLMSACSGNSASTNKDESSTGESQASSTTGQTAPSGITVSEDGWFAKYDPPITLTTHTVVDANALFHEGSDAENNGWTKWMEENLGIKWKMKWISPDSATNSQKLDLAFASDDLPDVIDGSVAQVAKFAAAGKLQSLDENIEKYASPFTKWHLEDAEEKTQGALWKPFLVDGKKYAMPVITDTLAFWTVDFIRDDLVTDLGKELPATIEDMDALFEAYHTKYPNGYALAMDKDLNGMLVAMTAYEAYPSMWVEKEGKLVYGSVQPEARAALEKLSEWYKKGYIDPEFVVKDSSKITEDVVNGNVLTYYGAWHAIGSPFTAMWNNLPNASVKPIPFVTNAEKKSGIMKDTWFTASRAITTSCKNPEAMLYLFNENLDSHYRSDQGLRDMMKEKYNYDFKYPVTERLEPTNVDEVAAKYPNAVEPKQLWLYDYPQDIEGAGYLNDFFLQPNGWFGFAGKPVSIANSDFSSMAEAHKTGDESVLTSDGRNMYNQWNSTHPNMIKTFAQVCDYWNELSADNSVLHSNGYAGAPTATMVEKQSYLDKLQLETYTRIIMGTQPITAFDEFAKNWNDNGGEQITKEVNVWYSQLG